MHETAVAWIRRRETRSRPAVPWSESPAELGTRLQTICQDINNNCDVDALCRRFPQRVQMVVDAEGDRINK